MIERGIVTETKKNKATIKFERKTECEKCGMCLFNKDNMSVSLTLKNKVDAKVGDTVEVGLGDKFVLTSALIVYIIPLILVGIGVGVSAYFNIVEWAQITIAVCGLVGGFVIAYFMDKLVKNKKGFSPVILNIVEKSKEKEENE